jgi:hypothetical protein
MERPYLPELAGEANAPVVARPDQLLVVAGA